MHEYIIPGKAYEVLIRNVGSGKVKDALTKGEKKNKGRGYRVFVKLTGNQAGELADLLVQVQSDKPAVQLAVREAIERLSMNGDSENDEKAKQSRLQQNRLSALGKARAARTAKAQAENAELIWAAVEPRIQREKCSCGLTKGMSKEDLDAITPSWGCVDSGRWVCPALDAYRRLLNNPAILKATETESEAA